MFASKSQQTIPIAFDAPHTVTIRKLTGRELERAQFDHLRSLVAGRSARGWAAHFQQKLAAGTAVAADAEKVLTDPLSGYDRTTIIRAGLLAWSYPDAITAVTVKGPDTAPDQIVDAVADLDDDGAEFIATEIMRLTKPALFQTAEDSEAARKNDSGPSIAV